MATLTRACNCVYPTMRQFPPFSEISNLALVPATFEAQSIALAYELKNLALLMLRLTAKAESHVTVFCKQHQIFHALKYIGRSGDLQNELDAVVCRRIAKQSSITVAKLFPALSVKSFVQCRRKLFASNLFYGCDLLFKVMSTSAEVAVLPSDAAYDLVNWEAMQYIHGVIQRYVRCLRASRVYVEKYGTRLRQKNVCAIVHKLMHRVNKINKSTEKVPLVRQYFRLGASYGHLPETLVREFTRVQIEDMIAGHPIIEAERNVDLYTSDSDT